MSNGPFDWQAEQAKDEQSLDFDERNYTDGAWWAEQDAARYEAEQDEIRRINAQAEIEDMRLNGYE